MGKKKDIALKVDNVSIKFNLAQEKLDSLKEYFIGIIKGRVSYDEFWALKNVSFELEKGDMLGILGLNGAGKSTILKVIAGVYRPTEGKVSKKGVLAPLLSLEQALIHSILHVRMSISMEQCWDTRRNLSMKNSMR